RHFGLPSIFSRPTPRFESHPISKLRRTQTPMQPKPVTPVTPVTPESPGSSTPPKRSSPRPTPFPKPRPNRSALDRWAPTRDNPPMRGESWPVQAPLPRRAYWRSRLVALSTLGCLSACASEPSGSDGEVDTESESSETGDPQPPDYGRAGPYSVGHRQITLPDPNDLDPRALPIEIWYPSEDALVSPTALIDLPAPGPFQVAFAELVDATPEACTPRTTGAQRELALATADDGCPLIVFS